MADQGSSDDPPPRGNRGGTTTVYGGGDLIRKSFLIDRDVEKALRIAAHRGRRSEASIVREVLRRHFGLD